MAVTALLTGVRQVHWSTFRTCGHLIIVSQYEGQIPPTVENPLTVPLDAIYWTQAPNPQLKDP